MNKMKILMIMMISFGLIASPAIAGCILPNADLFYGVKADSQSGISVSDNPRKSLVAEVDLKEKKGTATLPDDMLRPEIFYGYTDFIAGDDESSEQEKNANSKIRR